jgi:hypothetical protein
MNETNAGNMKEQIGDTNKPITIAPIGPIKLASWGSRQ